jgi:phthiocerol/phenolphthiocerol synthesis type-I polyketide synthase E
MSVPTKPDDSLAIAIVGMACRLPGARDVREFWRNLREGRESIETFDDDAMRAFGVDPALLARPDFVRAGARLADADGFDARFFGYAPRAARLLDPQHRVFLECAWAALEDAGYAPPIAVSAGVYAGTSLSSYLLYRLLDGRPPGIDDTFPVMIANDKDFLATRVCYELDLRGPGITLQTGCSTSLVAIHFACQGLLTFQCDLALAGGVSVQVPERTGYLYQEGGISSPDGHCRAFDARAAGTIFGSGAGVVVLKRLEEALADRDQIYAIVRGTAINNDGARKVGFTAPSVGGQADVIRAAHAVAGVDPATIGYVETHGTGTALGDPVEVAALTEAFGADLAAGGGGAIGAGAIGAGAVGTCAVGTCAIGSVKTNIGHLDAAAGVAALIKTALALRHRQLPPSLHFETPNPRIPFDRLPFYVNDRLRDWPRAETPRRAGVSSFGIGGTNAHAVLEEAPARVLASSSRVHHVLVLSAKTESALDAVGQTLTDHLREKHLSENHANAADSADSAVPAESTDSADAAKSAFSIADAAYTLQVGRKPFAWRCAIVCRDAADAVSAMINPEPPQVSTAHCAGGAPPVVFMFPGGGAQHAGMAAGLYASEPVFREHFDAMADLVYAENGLDLRRLMRPGAEALDLKQTETGLCALFAVEYALAQLWLAWGVTPAALIGHSLGEYVAACLAEVFSPRDAVRLVVQRGRLFATLPPGAMLSVAMPAGALAGLLDADVSIAAVNGADHFVLAGRIDAIDRLAARMRTDGIEFRRLHIDVAAHSPLVDAIAGEFERAVRALARHAPTVPVISNVSGGWLTADEATSPEYWAAHLRHTVRFGDGLATLKEMPSPLLLEVGPGQTLTALARAAYRDALPAIASMRHPLLQEPDDGVLAHAVAKLWLGGVEIDWRAYHANEPRGRVSLPTYPFEHEQFEPERAGRVAPKPREDDGTRRADVGEWFYAPSWRRSARQAPEAIPTPAVAAADGASARVVGNGGGFPVREPIVGSGRERSGNAYSVPIDGVGAASASVWLIFADRGGLGTAMAASLRAAGHDVHVAIEGAAFRHHGEALSEIRATMGDHARLWEELTAAGRRPARIVHLWSVTGSAADVIAAEGIAAAGTAASGIVADGVVAAGIAVDGLAPDGIEAGARDTAGASAGDAAIARTLDLGFYSLLWLAKAIAGSPANAPVRIDVIADGLHQVEQGDIVDPTKATLLGACKVIPQELDGVTITSIDLPSALADAFRSMPADAREDTRPRRRDRREDVRERTVGALLGELFIEAPEPVRALRGRVRWIQEEEPVPLPSPAASPIREGGVYMILGGLGDVGSLIAARFASSSRCHLVLTGRAPLPAPDDRARWLHERGDDDPVSRKLRRLRELEAHAASVEYADVDLSDEPAMRALIERIDDRHGHIDGVVMAAGDAGIESVRLIADIDRDACERQFHAKLHGIRTLARVLHGRTLDFCLLSSSTTSLLGGIGSVAYTAANLFVDAFASAREDDRARWLSVNWDGWPLPPERQAQAVAASIAAFAMSESEATDACLRAIASGRRGQLIASTGVLAPRKRFWITEAGRAASRPAAREARTAAPASERPFAPPNSPAEETLVQIWQEQLGLDRIGIHDNFFELGGTSLIGLRIVAAVKASLAIVLPIVSLFEHPTVSRLAKSIAGETAAPSYAASQERGASRRARQARRRASV